jgi:hypothetical protein
LYPGPGVYEIEDGHEKINDSSSLNQYEDGTSQRVIGVDFVDMKSLKTDTKVKGLKEMTGLGMTVRITLLTIAGIGAFVYLVFFF